MHLYESVEATRLVDRFKPMAVPAGGASIDSYRRCVLDTEASITIWIVGSDKADLTERSIDKAAAAITFATHRVEVKAVCKSAFDEIEESGSPASGGDVVLIRAGAIVFDGWLDRLRAAAYAAPEFGTASPFSNGPWAIGAYPSANELTVRDSDAPRFDQVAARMNGPLPVALPAPGNCCIYLRADYLAQRQSSVTQAHQRRHALAANVFVHWKGELVLSPLFASGRPGKQLEEEVDAHLCGETLRPLRRNLDLALLAGSTPAVLMITHVGGGGTEKHVRDMVNRLEQEGIRSLILRPGTRGRVRLERLAAKRTPNLEFDTHHEYDCLVQALRELGIAHIHVQHLLGIPVEFARRIVRDLDLPYDLTLHDYFYACPRIHLHDEHGRYCGEPSPTGCNACLARLGNYAGQRDGTTIQSWRDRHQEWMRGARQVYVPHNDVARRISRYFPGVRFQERPHFENWRDARRVAAPYKPGEGLRVVILGTIGPHKGSGLLVECAEDALARGLDISFVVIGNLNLPPGVSSTAPIEVTGEYREDDIFDLLQKKAAHVALFLSVMPETYCYTLSIARLACLYPIGIDIGAIGARITESGWGEVLPLSVTAAEVNDRLVAISEKLHTLTPLETSAGSALRYPNLLVDYYDLNPGDLLGAQTAPPANPQIIRPAEERVLPLRCVA